VRCTEEDVIGMCVHVCAILCNVVFVYLWTDVRHVIIGMNGGRPTCKKYKHLDALRRGIMEHMGNIVDVIVY
jgi:hypothetical protein